MRRIARTLLSLVVLVASAAHCSVLVDADISELRCTQEGMIGAPACDPGQICAEGRCHACLEHEVCSDGIDNDCDGRVDERCQGEGGATGGQGTASEGGAGGSTAGTGSDAD